MLRQALSLSAVAILTMAAAPAKPAGPKAAAPKAAAKPAPGALGAAGPFDARDPASLIALLATMDAKAEIASKNGEEVFLKVTTPAYAFSALFAGCDAQGRACKAVAFSTQSDKRTATIAELNAFNQTSIACRVFQDKQGKPHALYSTLVFAQDTRPEMTAHLGAWQGCMANFGEFLTDPTAYLASAP